jgi:hypothetical protein
MELSIWDKRGWFVVGGRDVGQRRNGSVFVTKRKVSTKPQKRTYHGGHSTLHLQDTQFRKNPKKIGNVVGSGICVSLWGYVLYQGAVDPLGGE